MGVRDRLASWPVVQQLQRRDARGLGPTAQSPRSAAWYARTADADRVVKSICPYCAVGCGQRVFVQTGASRRSRAIPTARSRAAGSARRARRRGSS